MTLETCFNCTSVEQLMPTIQTQNTSNETLGSSVEWALHVLPAMQMFFIPSSLCSFITLLLNPLILMTILLKDRLCQETRYLLLANLMLADLIFLLFLVFVSTSNILHMHLGRVWCSIMIVICFAAYFSCLLTFTMMVVDTYIAVSYPLHYYSLLFASRVKNIVGGIWIMSSFFPAFVFVLLQAKDPILTEETAVCLVLYLGPDIKANGFIIISVGVFTLAFLTGCSFLIVGFYVRLYYTTRVSGIWLSRFSRARMTLLIHSFLLLLYVIPGIVCISETLMFHTKLIGLEARLWIATANSGVLMVLPRALAPILYGLRYREVLQAIKNWFPERGGTTDI